MARNYGKCMCPGCIRVGNNAIPLKDRGGKLAYLCDEHLRNTMGYSFENNNKVGTIKVLSRTYGVEFETANSTEIGRINMLNMGFVPTYDGSLAWTGVEYKSGIYQGAKAIIKHCDSIDTLISEGHITLDSDCGTHLHVGDRDYLTPETIRYLRRFYNTLFIPLTNAIDADLEKARRFWGRNFTYYADRITENTTSGNLYGDEMPHTTFVNLQHDYTIEFRLCKFQNAEQYKQLVRFADDVLTTIVNNFIKHFNDTDFNTAKFPTIKEYRKHQAEKTAKKIVMLYNKYTANI